MRQNGSIFFSFRVTQSSISILGMKISSYAAVLNFNLAKETPKLYNFWMKTIFHMFI